MKLYSKFGEALSFFSELELLDHSFEAVRAPGLRLYTLGRVTHLIVIDNDVIATVEDSSSYKVVVGRTKNGLCFNCNCGFSNAGACSHAVAVMHAANAQAAIQVGINWDAPTENTGESPDSFRMAIAQNITDVNEQRETSIRDLPSEKPVMRLYLSEQEGMLLVEVRFIYSNGMVEFARSDTAPFRVIPDRTGTVVRVHRSRARETALAVTLLSFELMQYQTGVYTPSIDPRVWTLQQLPQLAAEGYEIYGQEYLQSTQARKNTPRLSVSVRSGESDFSVTVNISVDGIPAPLASLIMAIRRKSRFILLSDGSSGLLPVNWLDTFSALFSTLEHEADGNTVRINRSQIGVAETLYDLADDHVADQEFIMRRERLQAFSSVQPQIIPVGFSAQLRPYQQAGFEWFYFLKEYHFGGCLADDMGLGKTVQTLALLCKEQQLAEARPSLIVVPNSLLFNWQREARKFAPSLTLLLYHGSNRHQYREIMNMADVVLTTYGTIIRDGELLAQQKFHYVILDEAQSIKNPASQISKAVRSLSSTYRLALSGTPVENNLSELWSLFSFLNPGMFGPLRSFVQNFIKPIERDMNGQVGELLRKMVFPFILRRTKAQVVRELPPKNEMVIFADMLPAQQTLYDITKQMYYGRITEAMDNVGVDGSRMQLLEGLLRLRQICTHPRLYDSTYNDDSGKFILVEEMLQDAVAEGHRVLVFSQFVKVLEMIRERCKLVGISTDILTGATSDRQMVVDRFQADSGVSVLLISLKAGGTGLNLTAADYVFHIDPWWNPSVENQASDRAYRIGQTKSVFVYKFITRDSIEERVLELQQLKRNLTDSIIQTEPSFFKNLTSGDIKALFQ